jgi:hypothetical protein
LPDGATHPTAPDPAFAPVARTPGGAGDDDCDRDAERLLEVDADREDLEGTSVGFELDELAKVAGAARHRVPPNRTR